MLAQNDVSCLHYASLNGHLDVVKYLCDKGGKVLWMKSDKVHAEHMMFVFCVFVHRVLSVILNGSLFYKQVYMHMCIHMLLYIQALSICRHVCMHGVCVTLHMY